MLETPKGIANAEKIAAVRPPSELLEDHSWVAMVDEHMIGNTVADKSQRPTTGAGVGEKADFWASKLIPARLHSHFQQRAPGKLNHKATNFFMRNASPAVAMAAHADQARADLECARSDTELLTRNGRFVHFSEIAGRKVAGAYGIADSEGSKIRSGSSVDMIERKAGAGGHDEGASKGAISTTFTLRPQQQPARTAHTSAATTKALTLLSSWVTIQTTPPPWTP